MASPQVGILALQGGFAAHADYFSKAGASCVFIKKPSQLDAVDLLVIPGGESTTINKLMTPLKMQEAIISFVASGKFVFATCAGLILLAKEIAADATHPSLSNPSPLGLLDITIQRNAYGRQIDSKIVFGDANQEELQTNKLSMPFIRAPKIAQLGAGVEVLASLDGNPVMVRQKNIIAASFHPELSRENFVAQYLLKLCNNK